MAGLIDIFLPDCREINVNANLRLIGSQEEVED
jgi:hypothetical protein